MRPRSLALATLIDVLPLDAAVDERDGYLVVRSSGNPTHYWGNLLVFEDAPGDGDGPRWERLFEAQFAVEPRVRHRTFAWDRTDGVAGRAREEFVARGYDLDDQIGLIAAPGELRRHPRENRDVHILALDPAADEELWDGVLELQVANRDAQFGEESYRAFAGTRLSEHRVRFRLGHGAWYVAIADGTVVAACGVVVTDGRGRFQAVDTAEAHRRRGICSRLVVEAAHRAAETYGAERLVIVADTGYHALGLYESLGFSRVEHVFGVCRPPATA